MFDSMFGEFHPETPRDLDEFKRATRRKLSGIRCPRHRRAPELRFVGESIKDVAISLSGCCDALMKEANRAIAAPAAPLSNPTSG
ncbi:MAG: hypothetical protein ACRD4P_01645 [Bryobacteraceae bacterium]